ncbi:hypothetical protein ABPG74_009870 [Tetrahymena malaccensis]
MKAKTIGRLFPLKKSLRKVETNFKKITIAIQENSGEWSHRASRNKFVNQVMKEKKRYLLGIIRNRFAKSLEKNRDRSPTASIKAVIAMINYHYIYNFCEYFQGSEKRRVSYSLKDSTNTYSFLNSLSVYLKARFV